MKSLVLIVKAFEDLLLPFFPSRSKTDYAFGFLVHPRDKRDVCRKYPFLRFLPERALRVFLAWFWPVTVSRITGLKGEDGLEIPGFVFSIPLTAPHMLEDRELALRQIQRAVRLAKARGVRLIGLGGLTSSVSAGGLKLLEQAGGVAITTGHAYTAHNVTSNIFALAERYRINPAKAKIGIVGAAGSIGEASLRILARAGYEDILLIDLPRKKESFEKLASELSASHPNIRITLSHQVRDVKSCDIIVAATNAPEALITAEDLKEGAIVVDDAQPSDVAADVLERSDVLAIEAGVVHTKGIRVNINMGLKDREDNFCCLAEVLILASQKHSSNYVINRATLAHVDDIAEKGRGLGFHIAAFQNRKEHIPEQKLATIGERVASNGIQL